MLANLPIMQTHFRIMKGVSERDLGVHTMDEAPRARNMDGLWVKQRRSECICHYGDAS